MILDICLTFGLQSITLFAAVILLLKIPPINGIYGYRTTRSSVDEKSWKFANKTAAILMVVFSILSMVVGSIFLILKYCASINIDFMWFIIPSAIVILILPIVITEILLIKRQR